MKQVVTEIVRYRKRHLEKKRKLEKEVEGKKVKKNKGYKVYSHAGWAAWTRKVALGKEKPRDEGHH